MKSRWKEVEPLRQGVAYLALASSIPPHSLRSTGRLFAGSRAVTRQLQRTDGVIGFALLAEPLRKHYATVSIWRDDEALAAFASAQPHEALMRRLAPEMNSPRFVRWPMSGDDGIPSWAEVFRRLA